MRIIYLSVILVGLCLFPLTAQEKRALLIGIGDYPEEFGWSKIHGNNDIEIIENTLLVQGFHKNNIKVLIDSAATFHNIVCELEALLLTAYMDLKIVQR